jgi:predicted ATPase
MLQRAIDSYFQYTSTREPMFADRGLPDTLGYARLVGLTNESLLQAIHAACMQYRYASLVFLAPPWKEIYKTDDERKQDFEEAERTSTKSWMSTSPAGTALRFTQTVSPDAQFILQRPCLRH